MYVLHWVNGRNQQTLQVHMSDRNAKVSVGRHLHFGEAGWLWQCWAKLLLDTSHLVYIISSTTRCVKVDNQKVVTGLGQCAVTLVTHSPDQRGAPI